MACGRKASAALLVGFEETLREKDSSRSAAAFRVNMLIPYVCWSSAVVDTEN